ncbi:hypothetical protein Fmac_031502 [Flemingia macrophylla]|uniref:Uncharacterized protein n=1 Tax=Flemingia macrophylla TaxID=520843 RepID=A0ABD1L2B7_9FABA
MNAIWHLLQLKFQMTQFKKHESFSFKKIGQKHIFKKLYKPNKINYTKLQPEKLCKLNFERNRNHQRIYKV